MKNLLCLVFTCGCLALVAQTPAGNNQEIQFNNGGSFGASTFLKWDGSTLFLDDMGTTSPFLYFRSEQGDWSRFFSENYGTNSNRMVFQIGDDGDSDYFTFRNFHWNHGNLDVLEIRRSYLLARGSRLWSESNQGTTKGTLHFDPESTTDHYGSAITFGASDTGSGETAQAGIYVRSDGSYGTKMYFSTTNSYAQGAKTGMMMDHNGNVGIGTLSPSAKLELLSPALGGSETLQLMKVGDATGDYLRISNATSAPGQFIPSISGYHTTDNRQALYLTGAIDQSNDSGSQPITIFDARISNGPVVNRPLFGWDSYGNRKMILTAGGNLGIGTTTPTHKLEVNGTIRSKEVKVEASPWPDYVFEPDYNLLSLEEIEAFIKSEKHLPEIPSAKEVEANGLMLGEMNRLLLQKIEELTLHLIEVNKENTVLRQQLTANSQGQNEKIEQLIVRQVEMMKLLKSQQEEIEKLKMN